MKRKKLTAILMTAALAGVIVFGCGSNSADEENTKNTSADAQDEEKEAVSYTHLTLPTTPYV